MLQRVGYSCIGSATLLLWTVLLVGLVSPFPLRAAESSPQSDTQPRKGTEAPAQGAEPGAKSTKTKLEPRDLMPSLLRTQPGRGSVTNDRSIPSRDKALLQRAGRINSQINREMRRIDNSIRKMKSDMNRTLSIRRRRY